MRRHLKWILVPVAVLALTACSGAGGSKVVGQWGGEGPGPHVSFQDAGTFEGGDGCNAFQGTWFQAGAEIIPRDVIVGAVGCPGDRPRLSSATSFQVRGEMLLAFDGQGGAVAELPRTGAKPR